MLPSAASRLVAIAVAGRLVPSMLRGARFAPTVAAAQQPRFSSSPSSGGCVPPATFFARVLEVEPKSVVEVDADHGNVSIENGDLCAVEIGATGVAGDDPDAAPLDPPEITTTSLASASSQQQQQNPGTPPPIRITVRSSSQGAALVTARIPERYCSLTARARAGSVRVERITEASLNVTARDSVDLASIRGTEVAVESELGDVRSPAGASGASVSLRAPSGAIEMKRVVGNSVEVVARGDVDLASVYADSASVASEAGSVLLGNTGCDDLLVAAEAGDVRVDGCTKNLRVLGCRSATIHLSRDCGLVHVSSVRETVRVTVEPGARVRATVRCARRLPTSGSDVREDPLDDEDPIRLEGATTTVVSAEGGVANQRTGNAANFSANSAIDSVLVVDAPEATVSIGARSWLAGLMNKPKKSP